MKRLIKALAFMAVLLAGSLSADETTVHGIHGTWWNPDYDGEGFVFEQYNDGLVIGYWYTYDNLGNQLWLIGTGQLEGDQVDLEMTVTEGGFMGSLMNPGSVSRETWGTVSLDIRSCKRIEMIYQGLGGETGGYELQRIVEDGLAETFCINTGEPEASLQEYDLFWGWQSRAIPLAGTAVMQKTIIGGGSRISHYDFRLVAEEGDLEIKSISVSDASGITDPSVEGLEEGMIIAEGQFVDFTLQSGFTNGQTVQLNYFIELRDIGTLVDLDVTLTTN